MNPERYVGIDIHKRHVVVAAVDQHQHLLLSPQKISVQGFDAWAHAHLHPNDSVGLEATTNAWEFHDHLVPIVKAVSVANSHKIKLISASPVKTDKHDAVILAKLLAAHLLPAIWVPPQAVRDLRALTQHRAQLIEERSAAKNRLHSLLHQHNLKAPEGNPFNGINEPWWKTLPLTPVEQLQAGHEWRTIHHLNQLLGETEAAIAQLSISEAWTQEMTYLMQLPGVGLYTGMTILAAIGDIQRFPTAKHLVGYAGLGARVHASGDSYRTGKISKAGRRELRTALIASAWVAVRWSDYWKSLFQSLARRLGKAKAITVIARKLLVVIWHVLTKRELDLHADPTAIARSLMNWCSLHHLAKSLGIPRREFVKQRLAQLGILARVPSFRANGFTHVLAES